MPGAAEQTGTGPTGVRAKLAGEPGMSPSI